MNIQKIKDNWFLYTLAITLIGALITFSSTIQAIASAPRQIDDLTKQVSGYIAANEEYKAQQNRLIDLLVEQRLRG